MGKSKAGWRVGVQKRGILHPKFPLGLFELDPGSAPHPRPSLCLWETLTQHRERTFRILGRKWTCFPFKGRAMVQEESWSSGWSKPAQDWPWMDSPSTRKVLLAAEYKSTKTAALEILGWKKQANHNHLGLCSKYWLGLKHLHKKVD